MTEFHFEVCCACGVEFGLPAHYNKERRQDGKGFYCPNGHTLSYGEGSHEKLRRERDLLRQRLAEKGDVIVEAYEATARAERTASTYKGHVTRIKNRVGKGACPCCNRTFQNLARHMNSKHPDYSQAAEEAA